MTKDVLIRINGFQRVAGGEPDNIELITFGSYVFINGIHFVVYEEMLDGINGSIHNVLQFSQGKFEIIKSGAVNSKMVFEPGKSDRTHYETPFGEMLIEIRTKSVRIEEQEDCIELELEYSMDFNYERVSENHLNIQVASKEKAELKL